MRALLAACILSTTAVSAHAADWRDDGLAEVEKTKVVVEAMFTQPISLWVSVQDDGTRRDGLAEGFCLDLYASGMPVGESVIITIWDASAMAREDLVELGKFRCKRNG